MFELRRGAADDLAAVAAIQSASPEAQQWQPQEYLNYEFRVALWDGQVVGFLVARVLPDGDSEILNLAVVPEFRRKGVGRRLLTDWLSKARGAAYLEVRESNWKARCCYESLRFKEIARRPEYYEKPSEAAIVMKFYSC